MGWVDLEGDVTEQLSALRAAPGGERLVGIRHLAHQDPDPGWLARPSVDFAALGDAGLPFDLVITPKQFAAASVAVESNPNTRFVLDHLGKPPIASGDLTRWRSDLAALASHANVVAKLSGLTMEARWNDWSLDDLRPVVDTALDTFGPERLLFGSDWPLVDLADGLDRWLHAADTLLGDLTEPQREAVFAGNTVTTYPGAPHA